MKKTFYLSILALFCLVSCNAGDVNSNQEAATEEVTIVDESSVSSETIEAKGNDNDILLDEYENLCNEYLKVMKEMSSSNINSVEEFQDLETKMTDCVKRLTENLGNFSDEQMNRYTNIVTKFSEETAL